jgi:hypothetical protein
MGLVLGTGPSSFPRQNLRRHNEKSRTERDAPNSFRTSTRCRIAGRSGTEVTTFARSARDEAKQQRHREPHRAAGLLRTFENDGGEVAPHAEQEAHTSSIHNTTCLAMSHADCTAVYLRACKGEQQ